MKLENARKRLRQRYVDGFPAKIAVLEQGMESSDEPGAESIRRLAHQLSGSAGSFGFPELGQLAKLTELAEEGQLRDRAESLAGLLRGIVRAEGGPPTRVLLIEDDDAVCEVVEASLASANQSIRRAQSMASAQEMLRAGSWDLIFLDLVLPDGDGRDLLAQIRTDETTQDTPVIVLTANAGPHIKNECAAYGIDQFIDKPIDSTTLPALVASSINRMRTLHREAYQDELTGLQNRFGFRQNYEKLSSLCRRNERPMSVAMLDLDFFKAINDEHGHEVGDKVLKTVAEVLRATLRESDLAGRWGGEEFIVALPETDAASANAALAKVADALRETTAACAPRNITFSAGVTLVHKSESLDMALLRADQILYAAKRSGRDRVMDAMPSGTEVDKLQLLLAEDDADTSALLIADLSEDYTVTHVACGDEALRQIQSSTYDVVVLDHDMPGLSGIEIVENLQESGSARCPILILTAAGSEELIERAFKAGAVDYVTKPYRRRELLARLARHVGSQR